MLLAAAIVAGVIALSERQGARDAATVADAQRLGAEALDEDRPDQALRLANTAVALDDSVATRSSLLSVLVRNRPALGVLNRDADSFAGPALSPDGRTLAVADGEGTVSVFDTQTRERIGDHQAPGPVWALAFDPRGDSLAITATDASDPKRYLQIVDPSTLEVRTSVTLDPHPADPGLGYYPTAVYAPDGRSVIVMYSVADADYSMPVFLRRFDAGSGSPLGPAVPATPKSSRIGLKSTADGRLLVSTVTDGPGGGYTYAIDADTLRLRDRYPVAAGTTAVSPDRRTLAFEPARGGGLRLLDLASGRVELLGRPQGDFGVAAFSPDGRILSTFDEEDGNLMFWDVETGALTQTFEFPAASRRQVFSPDGDTLYTDGADSVIVWDVDGDRRLIRPFHTNTDTSPFGSLPTFAISPDARTLAVARPDGRVDLIDAQTLRRAGGFEAFTDRALAIEYSPDGGLLAVAGGRGGVGLWETGSGKRVGRRCSPPGRRLRTRTTSGHWPSATEACSRRRAPEGRTRPRRRPVPCGSGTSMGRS